MSDRHDLQLTLSSSVPIIVIETHDEARFLNMLTEMAVRSTASDYRPLFRWSITDGLQRIDLDLEPQTHNIQPEDVLKHIRAVTNPGIYVLLDFHPYLNEPVNIRLLKDIAIQATARDQVLVLASHEIQLPPELERLSARFALKLPDDKERSAIVRNLIDEYQQANQNTNVKVDEQAFRLLVQNLGGLTHADTERLARNAVYQDGVISTSDIPAVMQAKYDLLNQQGVLSFEHDTAGFGEVGGFRALKVWLAQRAKALRSPNNAGLDPPKGLLLLGVQGCGKSLAAKAVAGIFGVPLLRLDFGSLYNKYHGESERNLRESLTTAEVMSPCVLWIDEIEKGMAGGHEETGTSQRILGTVLTWMAERQGKVFLVATANDISVLPPELVRKGRFDEIFFVDLPNPEQRAEIYTIHARSRDLDPAKLDLQRLVHASEGFSGAEIEQSIVAALYAAHALKQPVSAKHILTEIKRTRPLSVLMAERIAELRHWARDRTVSAN